MQLQINTPRVVHETVDSEVVAIDFENGNYYCLRNTAAYIWSLIDRGASCEQAVAEVARRFQQQPEGLRQEIVEFVDELCDRALVVPTKQSSEPFKQSSEADCSDTYQRPELVQYTDLQQLLLLDPIHEVNQDTGWPRAQT